MVFVPFMGPAQAFLAITKTSHALLVPGLSNGWARLYKGGLEYLQTPCPPPIDEHIRLPYTEKASVNVVNIQRSNVVPTTIALDFSK